MSPTLPDPFYEGGWGPRIFLAGGFAPRVPSFSQVASVADDWCPDGFPGRIPWADSLGGFPADSLGEDSGGQAVVIGNAQESRV